MTDYLAETEEIEKKQGTGFEGSGKGADGTGFVLIFCAATRFVWNAILFAVFIKNEAEIPADRPIRVLTAGEDRLRMNGGRVSSGEDSRCRPE